MEDTEQYTSIHKGKTMTSSSAQAERTITFQSAGQPSFLLEGILHVPPIEKPAPIVVLCHPQPASRDRKSTRLNSSHQIISYAVFCLKQKQFNHTNTLHSADNLLTN